MSVKEQIAKAVAAHSFWKVRLQQALVARKVDVPAATARRDDACEFGKWLRQSGPDVRASEHHRKASELHARFHEAVGNCVHEIEAGHIEQARRVLEGDVMARSTDLTREMIAWNKEVDKQPS